MSELHIVIMAGGIGSRLWPLSTPQLPKQFVDVLNCGKTLIQSTVERFMPLCPVENIWVVTSKKYADIVRAQLPQIPSEHVLLEPVGRNTAPCIAYACRKIALKHPDASVVVSPSDALVLEKDKYVKIVSEAVNFIEASDENRIVTIGIEPTRPETGYGYICASEPVKSKIVKVNSFCEKPDLDTAKSYLSEGNYFWNAGVFIWRVQSILSELRSHAAQISQVMDALEPYLYTPQEQSRLEELFPTCEKISIDYAVMEKSEHIFVISEDLGWSDLGTWASLQQYRKESEGVELHDCKDCICAIEEGQRLIAIGLENYIIAVKDGKILICPASREQDIKNFV